MPASGRVCDHVGLRRTSVTIAAMMILAAAWLLQAQAPAPAPQVPPPAPPAPAAPVAPTPEPGATRGGTPPATTISPESLFARGGPPTVILDPGHGGDDIGTKGAGGAQEKQLTLDIARRLRPLLEMRLGVHVMLTRDADVAVPIESRVAFANNHKGDLFLSLHMNAAPSSTVEGAEVYYLQLDRDGEQARQNAARTAVAIPTVGGATRTLELIPWDVAQARHIEASTMLANALASGLGARLPAGSSPIRSAPLRVLEGVNMPAALVELAFLSSPAQEKDAVTEEFKNMAAQGLADAVVTFRGQLDDERAR
jgi:N-acetylmuramoyl-L-alanine amidase